MLVLEEKNLERVRIIAETEAEKRGFDWIAHLATMAALEKTAPYGRCSLCNLALSEQEKERWGDKHDNCAADFYE